MNQQQFNEQICIIGPEIEAVTLESPQLEEGKDERVLLPRSYVYLEAPSSEISSKGHIHTNSSESNAVPSFDQSSARITEIIDGGKFTDLIVLSHGWHRNRFGAISAYDRLSAIFLDLYKRRRLQSPSDGFNPLIIGFHYHSDTGVDSWTDTTGRRDREDFLRLVRERLDPLEDITEGQMTSAFEELYEYFSKFSAPNVDPGDKGLQKEQYKMEAILADYGMSGISASSSTPNDVVTVAWSCYHDAAVAPQTNEQTDDAGTKVTFGQWAGRIIAIVLSAIPILSLLPAVRKALSKTQIGQWVAQNAVLCIVGLFLLCWAILLFVSLSEKNREKKRTEQTGPKKFDRKSRHARESRGFNTFVTICYLPVQLVHIAPLILWCLITPFFATWPGIFISSGIVGVVNYLQVGQVNIDSALQFLTLYWPAITTFLIGLMFGVAGSGGHLSECLDFKSTKTPQLVSPPQRIQSYVKTVLYWFAIVPIRVAEKVSREGQRWVDVWTSVKNLLAFWDMYKRAVVAGGWLGSLLEKSVKESKNKPRVHLVGHSHGGLVVCNAAGWLTREEVPETEVVTLATINGAYRSDWFNHSPFIIERITGCVSSVFSARDTANNFWYPLANFGQKSSGSVGLYAPNINDEIGWPLPSVTLTDALIDPVSNEPDMVDRLKFVGTTNPSNTRVLNIDASRFVFRGPVLPQGAHTDIFSKDAVATLWRALLFANWRKTPNTSSTSSTN